MQLPDRDFYVGYLIMRDMERQRRGAAYRRRHRAARVSAPPLWFWIVAVSAYVAVGVHHGVRALFHALLRAKFFFKVKRYERLLVLQQ